MIIGDPAGRCLMTDAKPDYYRRDQTKGITPPELSKDCTFAEHIVRARGKRTRYTSVSLDKEKITDFGPTLYLAIRDKIEGDGHTIIEHSTLMNTLRHVANTGEKEDRLRAVQAQRYATKRKEGLVEWNFDISRIERKSLFVWSAAQTGPYFRSV
jgi:hypothetical protein